MKLKGKQKVRTPFRNIALVAVMGILMGVGASNAQITIHLDHLSDSLGVAYDAAKVQMIHSGLDLSSALRLDNRYTGAATPPAKPAVAGVNVGGLEVSIRGGDYSGSNAKWGGTDAKDSLTIVLGGTLTSTATDAGTVTISGAWKSDKITVLRIENNIIANTAGAPVNVNWNGTIAATLPPDNSAFGTAGSPNWLTGVGVGGRRGVVDLIGDWSGTAGEYFNILGGSITSGVGRHGYAVSAAVANSPRITISSGTLKATGRAATSGTPGNPRIAAWALYSADSVILNGGTITGDAWSGGIFSGKAVTTGTGSAAITVEGQHENGLIEAGSIINLRRAVTFKHTNTSGTYTEGTGPVTPYNATIFKAPSIYMVDQTTNVGAGAKVLFDATTDSVFLSGGTVTADKPLRLVQVVGTGVNKYAVDLQNVNFNTTKVVGSQAIKADNKDVRLLGTTVTVTGSRGNAGSTGSAIEVAKDMKVHIVASSTRAAGVAVETAGTAMYRAIKTVGDESEVVLESSPQFKAFVSIVDSMTAIEADSGKVWLVGSHTQPAEILGGTVGRAILTTGSSVETDADKHGDITIINGRIGVGRTIEAGAIVAAESKFATIRIANRESASTTNAARSRVVVAASPSDANPSGTGDGVALSANKIEILAGSIEARGVAIKADTLSFLHGTNGTYGYDAIEPTPYLYTSVHPTTTTGNVANVNHTGVGLVAQKTVNSVTNSAIITQDSLAIFGRVDITGGQSSGYGAVIVAGRRDATTGAFGSTRINIMNDGANVTDSIYARGNWTALRLEGPKMIGTDAKVDSIGSSRIRSQTGSAVHVAGKNNVGIGGSAILWGNGTRDSLPTLRVDNEAHVTLSGSVQVHMYSTGVAVGLTNNSKLILDSPGAHVDVHTTAGTGVRAVGNTGDEFVLLKSGKITNSQTGSASGTPSLVRILGGTEAGPEQHLIKVTGGTISTQVAGGRAIFLTGRGSVEVTGGTVEAIGNNVAAIAIVTDSTESDHGNVFVIGNATTNNAPIVRAAAGTGIQTRGGRIEVSVPATAGATATVETITGTGIRAIRPIGATARSGSVRIGDRWHYTNPQGTPPTLSALALVQTKAESGSNGGIGVNADDSVFIYDNGSVGTILGKAVVGGRVELITGGTGNKATAYARGITRDGSGTNPIAIESRNISVGAGSLVQGNEHATGYGQGIWGSNITGISIPTPPAAQASVVSEVQIAGDVLVWGGGFGIHNDAASNVQVRILNGGRVWVGNNGTAIHTSGRVTINGQTVFNRLAITEAMMNVRGGDNAIGIRATGASRPIRIGDDAVLIVDDGAASRVIETSAGVPLFIYGGYLEVGEGGTAVLSRGGVRLGTDAIDGVGDVVSAKPLHWAPEVFVSGATGTAIQSTTHEVVLLNASIRSLDRAVVAPSLIIGNNEPAAGWLSSVTTPTCGLLANDCYKADISGTLFTDVDVRENGVLGVYDKERLIVPDTADIRVRAGGRIYIDGTLTERDTLIVHGTVNTAGVLQTREPGFGNAGGYLLVSPTANFSFDVRNPETFRTGTNAYVVLSEGAKFNNAAINYLYWADTIANSGFYSAGTNQVVIPPIWADTASGWGFDKFTATDTVYNVFTRNFNEVIHERFQKYKGDADLKFYRAFAADSGRMPTGYGNDLGNEPIKIDSMSGIMTGVLSQAGTYTFGTRVTNMAGSATRNFTVNVLRANVDVGHHLTGYVLDGAISRPFNEGTEAQVAYTGNRIQASIAGRDTIWASEADGTTQQRVFRPYDDFGLATLHYRREDAGSWTTTPPTNVGTYEVAVSLTRGANFNAVPAPTATTYAIVGKVVIEPVQVTDLLDGQHNISVLLPVGVADPAIEIPLPAVSTYGARYELDDGYVPQISVRSGEDVFVEGSALVKSGPALTFAVTNKSEIGDWMTFSIRVTPVNATNANISEGTVTVTVTFEEDDERREEIPHVAIDFTTERLNGFERRKLYEISLGGATVATVPSTGIDFPIDPAWLGSEIGVVAVKTTQYMFNSLPLVIDVPARLAAPSDTLFTLVRPTPSAPLSGAIEGTTSAMEIRPAGSSAAWTRATSGRTSGLAAGAYEVRLRATDTDFASEAVVLSLTVGVLESDRDVPVDNGDAQAVIVNPVRVTQQFTAGPNPTARSVGKVTFFWSGDAITSGTLSVFSANGSLVRRINVTEATANREIGSWNLTDTRGRSVADGTYLVKGTLRTANGQSVQVSQMVGVR